MNEDDGASSGYNPKFDAPASLIFELSSEEGDTLHDALLEAWDDLRDSTAWSEWYLGVRRKMERPNWTWLIAFGDHSERAFSVTKSEFMLEVPADEVNGAASLQGYMRALLIEFFARMAEEGGLEVQPVIG